MTPEAYEAFCKAKGQDQPFNVCKQIGKGQIVDLDPETTKILDVGCGPGMNGILLGEKGFKNIFGVDASQNLIDNLKNIPSYKESR